MKLVRAFAAVLVFAAAAHGGPDLPDDIAGQASNWTSLADAAMSPGDASKWKRDKEGVTGTNSGADWSVCAIAGVCRDPVGRHKHFWPRITAGRYLAHYCLPEKAILS